MKNRWKGVACTAVLLGVAWPASGQTLRDALQTAYANNPSLAVQRTQTSIAGEQLRQAKAGRRPTIEGNASYVLQRNSTTRFAGFAPPPTDGGPTAGEAFFNTGIQNVGSAQFVGEQLIYGGGRVNAAIKEAKAGRGAAYAQLEVTQQDIFLQVVAAYVNVRRGREAISIRENSVALLSEEKRAADDRFEVGAVTRTDVALAAAQLEGARAELALEHANLEASIADYELVVGRRPDDLGPPPPLPTVPESYEAALQIARVQSPDIAAAQYNIAAAQQGIATAKSGLRPSLSIVGQAGVQETIGDFQDTNVSATAQARVPLYQGGLLRSRVREARLATTQARQQAEAIERQVVLDVSRGWFSYVAAQRSIVASQKQAEAAEIAYEGGQEELAAGVRTTLDVLDQEQALLEARLSVIEAERDAYIAAHQLLRAMGQLSPELFGFSAYYVR